MEGVGRFGWVTDPKGNRVELWQPAFNRVLIGSAFRPVDIAEVPGRRSGSPGPWGLLGPCCRGRLLERVEILRPAGIAALDAFTTLTGWSVFLLTPY